MRTGCPEWIFHMDLPINSVDVQPNGYRVVTAGQDSTVKVWNMLPILYERYEQGETAANSECASQEEEKSELGRALLEDIRLMESLVESKEKRTQKLLAYLDKHECPVNCVRWNSLGTLFASGSDDGSIILWEYNGMTAVTSFQKSLENAACGSKLDFQFTDMSASRFAEAEEEQEKAKKLQEKEENWNAKRVWKGHERSKLFPSF